MGRSNYLDEADLFYFHPLQWLNKQFPNATQLPSHLVFFNVLEQVRKPESPDQQGLTAKGGLYVLTCLRM